MSINILMPTDKCTCKLCGIRCKNAHDLKKHTIKCSERKTCENCNLKCSNFSGIRSFYLHCILCRGSVFQCPFCENKMFSLDRYEKCKRHYLRCTQRICGNCQETFNTPKDLKEHGNKEHSTYCCHICNAFFISKKQLNCHQDNRHKGRDK